MHYLEFVNNNRVFTELSDISGKSFTILILISGVSQSYNLGSLFMLLILFIEDFLDIPTIYIMYITWIHGASKLLNIKMNNWGAK